MHVNMRFRGNKIIDLRVRLDHMSLQCMDCIRCAHRADPDKLEGLVCSIG